MQATAARRSKIPALARGLLTTSLVLTALFLARPFLPHITISAALAATYVLVTATTLLVTLVVVPLPRTPWTARAAQHTLVALLMCLGTDILPDFVPLWFPLSVLIVLVGGVESPRWASLLGLGVALMFARSTAAITGMGVASAAIGFVGLALASALSVSRLKARNLELGRTLTKLRHGADFVDLDADASLPGTGSTFKRTSPLLRRVSDEARTARELERSEHLTGALAPFLELARGMNKAHAALFFDVDRSRGGAFLRATDGPKDLIREDAVMSLNSDPLSFVLERGRTFYATDFRSLLWSLPYYRHEVKIGTLLAVPVLVRGVISGVLVVDHEETQALSNAEPVLLRLGSLIAQAVESERETVAHQKGEVEFEAAASASQSLALFTEVDEIHRFINSAIKEMAPRTISSGLLRLRGETIDGLPGMSDQFKEWIGPGTKITERTWISWYLDGPAELCRINTPQDRGLPLFRPGGGLPGETLLAHPLRFRNRLLGALIAVGEHGAFDASVERVISLISNQAAAAIELIELVETNRALAMHDGLTGLLNRRAFDESLARAVAQSSRGPHPVSLLMVDLDHFKKLNDSWGHSVGDLALQAAAAEIRAQIRAGDLGARYGGEEFAVILPDTDGAAAFRLAERMRKALAGRVIKVGRDQIRISASLGVSASDLGYETPEELIRSADEALYASKETGRNRTSLAGAPRR